GEEGTQGRAGVLRVGRAGRTPGVAVVGRTAAVDRVVDVLAAAGGQLRRRRGGQAQGHRRQDAESHGPRPDPAGHGGLLLLRPRPGWCAVLPEAWAQLCLIPARTSVNGFTSSAILFRSPDSQERTRSACARTFFIWSTRRAHACAGTMCAALHNACGLSRYTRYVRVPRVREPRRLCAPSHK